LKRRARWPVARLSSRAMTRLGPDRAVETDVLASPKMKFHTTCQRGHWPMQNRQLQRTVSQRIDV
jgi:hypothetical protein